VFVRKKKNPNDKYSVQVVEKRSGKYVILKNFGVAKSIEHLQSLMQEANQWIKSETKLGALDFNQEEALFQQLFEGIQSLKLVGLELVIGKIFDDIGFNKINDKIFRYLCLYRVSFPVSKLKTTEYLYRYHQFYWDEDKIYRYLDKLYHHQKEMVQQISYEHTLKLLGEKIQIVFYDVTTLHFEIDDEDELRKTGFSKEGKHQHPQVLLGLLVSSGGYPLAYDIFEGNKFEGHTLIGVIEGFRKKYQLGTFTVVADAGLLSNDNIEWLIDNGYEFILGARIKNESQQLKNQLLATKFTDGTIKVFKKDEHCRLIVSYSNKRAGKDQFNRERGLKKLEKQIGGGKLSKNHLNNRGYNKYLKIEGGAAVHIDYEKYYSDAFWDGLKGYITNSTLSKEEIIENYGQLWQIEKAFRISKSGLKIRPVYHHLPRRIEAHICLTFVAYKLYKELERIMKNKKSDLSPRKAIEIAMNIFEMTIQSPITGTTKRKILLLTEEQKNLATLLNF
jgi:transposase